MSNFKWLLAKELYENAEKAYANKQPFVIYKKNTDNNLTAYFQNTNALQLWLNFKQKGFVFAPFQEGKNILFSVENSRIFYAKIPKESYKENDSFVNFGEEVAHKKIVDKTISFIKQGKAEKVVISRREKVVNSNFNAIETFKKLLFFYPTAMVYCWYHPQVGLWLGATPEKLLTISKNTLHTMSLASTRAFNGSFAVNWNAKEKEEQQIVTNYILEILQSASKKVYAEKPSTVKAGNLLHLQSKIKAELEDDFNLEKVLKALHPTPAVAGFPKQKAIQFILDNEGYDREYYSGYLGELNVENTTTLYVNLRCMKYENDKAIVYVGGGITRDSDSYKEWQETVEKTKTIKKALDFN